MNNRTATGLLVCAVLAVVLAAACSRQQSSVVPSSNGVPETLPGSSGDRAEARTLDDLRTRRERGRAPEEIALGVILAGDTRFVALSEEERAWLDRHYYLTQADIDAAKHVPDEALQRALTDPYAQTIWGKRLLQRGNVMGGIAVLKNAASHGSVYAYEEAALAVLEEAMQRNGGRADNQQVLAFRSSMEVAKILGDHRADAMFDHHFPGYDERANAHNIQQQTTEFLRQLGENAQLQGTAATGADPRPNADEWLNLAQLAAHGGTGDLVPVHQR